MLPELDTRYYDEKHVIVSKGGLAILSSMHAAAEEARAEAEEKAAQWRERVAAQDMALAAMREYEGRLQRELAELAHLRDMAVPLERRVDELEMERAMLLTVAEQDRKALEELKAALMAFALKNC